MHACVWLPACMSTHVCGAWESTFAMFLRCHPAWFLRKGLSLTWSSWITLGWFVNLGPACGPLSIGRIINMNKYVQTLIIIVYKVGSGKSNSGPHACNANALETESSPQFWIFSRLQFVTMISNFYFFPMIFHPKQILFLHEVTFLMGPHCVCFLFECWFWGLNQGASRCYVSTLSLYYFPVHRTSSKSSYWSHIN